MKLSYYDTKSVNANDFRLKRATKAMIMHFDWIVNRIRYSGCVKINWKKKWKPKISIENETNNLKRDKVIEVVADVFVLLCSRTLWSKAQVTVGIRDLWEHSDFRTDESFSAKWIQVAHRHCDSIPFHSSIDSTIKSFE